MVSGWRQLTFSFCLVDKLNSLIICVQSQKLCWYFLKESILIINVQLLDATLVCVSKLKLTWLYWGYYHVNCYRWWTLSRLSAWCLYSLWMVQGSPLVAIALWLPAVMKFIGLSCLEAHHDLYWWCK